MKRVCWLLKSITKLDNRALVLHVFVAAAASISLTHLVAIIDSFFEQSGRPSLEAMGDLSFFLLAVIFSPVVETLLFQMLPVSICLQRHRSAVEAFLWSSIPFALMHSAHGLGIFIGVGVVCGVIFGLSAVLWAKRSLAASFWVVCSVHALHNFYFYAGDRLLP
jgi:hypothetical protein